MKRHFLYSTVLAGLLGVGTLCLFYSGAQALDLGDFTGTDRKVITEQAPKAGGIVLVKEDIVYPAQHRARAPMLIAGGNATTYNNLTPAAGNDGSTGQPGLGIANKLDITTMPGNAFDQVQARFNQPGNAESAPVDGKPLTTTTTAEGMRIGEDLNAITPAAGGNTLLHSTGINSSVKAQQSIQSMTGRRTIYNN